MDSSDDVDGVVVIADFSKEVLLQYHVCWIPFHSYGDMVSTNFCAARLPNLGPNSLN